MCFLEKTGQKPSNHPNLNRKNCVCVLGARRNPAHKIEKTYQKSACLLSLIGTSKLDMACDSQRGG